VRSASRTGAKDWYLLEGVFNMVIWSTPKIKKTSNPKTKTARCWCKRAVESGVRVRYRFRPCWRSSSSSASEIDFMGSMYHKFEIREKLMAVPYL
jgi:hypothetical protein